MANHAVITGGAGFIGSRLSNRLISRFDRVWIIDNLHEQVHGKNSSIPDFPPQVTFVRGDVRDSNLVKDVIGESGASTVFHLASETGTGQSMDEIARYCEVNVTGTANVLEATRKLDQVQIVLASSRAVYGEGAYRTESGEIRIPGHRDMDEMARGNFAIQVIDGEGVSPIPTPENAPTLPVSVYASTKLMQEYLVQNASVADNIDYTILRLQNVFGDGQSLRNPYTGVLSIFISQLLDGRNLNIYEDGLTVRDFVYVDDVCRALDLASASEQARGQIINVGSGIPVTIESAAQEIIRQLGLSNDRYQISGDFRPGDIRYAIADITCARDVLAWEFQVSFAEGITKLIDWSKLVIDESQL